MMRNAIAAGLLLGLMAAGCARQDAAAAADGQLADFVPPTVRARGDVVPQAQRRFGTLDRNDDGALVAAEFPRDGARRLATLDTDRDGTVSRSEFVEAALRRFDRADANRDAQVVPSERDAARNGA